jgi:class 3 adenylate cyclase/tetratricopeptide (TPR) repeat protein
VTCPHCGQANPTGAKFCLECGQRLPAGCVACGRPLPASAKFCPECGAATAGSAAPVAGVTAGTTAPGGSGPSIAGPPPDPAAGPALAYTPRHLAQKILATRSALEGERKSVTVLFCDVVRSTALAERLGAEGMHALLGRFFELALTHVHRYEGTVNQFLGDGFMALFGAPLAHEDHARRAALAALDLRAALTEQPIEAGGVPVPLAIRLGLHTGFVVVGAIGDNLRMDYTAVGDTTHLAARLQQLAGPGEILLTDATARLVRGYVTLEARGRTEIRGVSAPVTLHALIGAGERRSPLEPDERPLSHFVGRDRELRALRDLLVEVEAGRGQVVGVVGEPGVGKSRLLLELQHALAGRSATYLEGRCLSFGGAIPYVPVLDVLRRLCGVGELDRPPREATAAALAELGVDEAPTAFLLQLLGHADPDGPATGLSPEATKARTFEAIRGLLLRASRRRPLVIAIEDLHWIDRTSEECLSGLVETLGGLPVMLLATYRPGYRPPWMDRSYATQLSLARLAAGDSLSVVRSVLPEAGLADPLAQLILDKAEGNPFFLEELARAVTESGEARPGLAIPDTVHGVLAARIDRLADLPKRLLQTASVLGREFPLRLLEAVWDGPPPRAHLHELTRQEFLHERANAEEPTFVFKHALTQDVAESTILAARRREVHARAAAALPALYGERGDELAPLLAHHAFQAEAWTDACAHATRAAERARAAFANREALERYDQALLAAERAGLPDAARVPLLRARGQVHGVVGALDEATRDLDDALAITRAAGDETASAELLGLLGELWGGHRDYRRGLDLTREAVRTAETAGDARATAEALVRSGLMHLNVAQLGESQRELERALAIFEKLGDVAGAARTLDILSMTDGVTTRLDRAVERGRTALRRFQELGERSTTPSMMTNIGFFLAFAGRRAQAEPMIRQGMEAAREQGALADQAYAHAGMAWLFEIYGEIGPAYRESEAALAIARTIDHREWTAIGLSILGRVTRMCGAPARARPLHEHMLAIARELGTALWISSSLAELGEDLIGLDEPERGERLLHEAIETAAEATQFVIPPRLALAELRLAQGRSAEAREEARRAEAAAGGYLAWNLLARRLQAEALHALGASAEAEALFREVHATAERATIAPAAWLCALARADILIARGQADEAAALRAKVRADLVRVTADLPEDLRATAATVSLVRRAGGI